MKRGVYCYRCEQHHGKEAPDRCRCGSVVFYHGAGSNPHALSARFMGELWGSIYGSEEE